MSTPQLRPLGVGEILDVAMKIAWRNAGTLVRTVVVIVFPIQVVSVLIEASALPAQTKNGVVFDSSNVSAAFAGFGIAGILTFIASTLAAGACYRAITSAYLGRQTGWRDSLSYAFHHFGSLIWITIITGVIAGLGLIACVIPGIYLWVSFTVAVPVLLTEGKRGTKAIWRSRDLVRGSWWRAFGVVVLGTLLAAIVGGGIGGLISAVTSINSNPGSVVWAVGAIVSGTISKTITTPFTAAFLTVLYFDLRVRSEGFDLQLLAQKIGVDPPAGGDLAAPALEPPPSAQPPFWPPPPGWKPPA